MKKILLFLTVSIITSLCVYAVGDELYSDLFLSRFMKCIPNTINQTVATENGTISISRKIGGWHEHKCTYTETTVSEEKSTSFTCNFSRDQVTELVHTMRYDPMGLSSAKTTWSRYKNNKEICSPN